MPVLNWRWNEIWQSEDRQWSPSEKRSWEKTTMHNDPQCSLRLSRVLSQGRGKTPPWHCPVPAPTLTLSHRRGLRTHCPANSSVTSDWENTAVTITSLRKWRTNTVKQTNPQKNGTKDKGWAPCNKWCEPSREGGGKSMWKHYAGRKTGWNMRIITQTGLH